MELPFETQTFDNYILLKPNVQDVNLYVSAAVRQQIVTAAGIRKNVFIQCDEIVSIDSAGIGAIIAAHLQLKKQEAKLFLVSASEPILRTLQMLKLEKQFTVVDSIDEVIDRGDH